MPGWEWLTGLGLELDSDSVLVSGLDALLLAAVMIASAEKAQPAADALQRKHKKVAAPGRVHGGVEARRRRRPGVVARQKGRLEPANIRQPLH